MEIRKGNSSSFPLTYDDLVPGCIYRASDDPDSVFIYTDEGASVLLYCGTQNDASAMDDETTTYREVRGHLVLED